MTARLCAAAALAALFTSAAAAQSAPTPWSWEQFGGITWLRPNYPLDGANGNFNGELDAAAFPGGDIGAKVNAAIAACPASCEITVPAGSYSYATQIDIGSSKDWIVGQGAQATIITYTGSADAINVGPCESSPYFCGGVLNLTVDGTTSAANGIHIVSTIGFEVRHVVVSGFGAGSGIFLDNQGSGAYTERTKLLYDSITGCAKGIRLHNTSGAASFGYSWLLGDHIQVPAGGVGISIEGPNLSLYHSHIAVNVSLFDNGSSTTAFSVTGGASLTDDWYAVAGENAAGASSDIGLLVDASSSIAGWGTIDWSNLTNSVAGTVDLGPSPVLSGDTIAAMLGAGGLDLGGAFATGDPVLQKSGDTLNGVPCFIGMLSRGVADLACVDSSGNFAVDSSLRWGGGPAIPSSSAVELSGANGSSRGTISISSATSGSHAFTAAYTAAPVCTATPAGTTPPATALSYAVSSTTTAVTVTLGASGTATFDWSCGPAVN